MDISNFIKANLASRHEGQNHLWVIKFQKKDTQIYIRCAVSDLLANQNIPLYQSHIVWYHFVLRPSIPCLSST